MITDQDNMAQWIGFNPVTVRKEGWTDAMAPVPNA